VRKKRRREGEKRLRRLKGGYGCSTEVGERERREGQEELQCWWRTQTISGFNGRLDLQSKAKAKQKKA
jgi:hypothetical protein